MPYDTGLTLRSFTQMALDNHRIRYFFDKNKIAIVPDHFTPNKDIKAAEQCKCV